MAIPDFQTIMRPLLMVLVDGQERPVTTIREALAQEFELSEEELQERLPNGRQLTFINRVAWALAHTKIARLVESPRRGVYRITQRGQQVLEQTSETGRVDVQLLKKFEEFRDRRPSSETSPSPTTDSAVETATPTERMLAAYGELRAAVAADVLERVQEQTPDFFEQLVLDVLHRMGYGGSREDATERLGRSGDGGVDGVIREDELGLDLIYVQAKRWTNTVGRPEIQQFVGALNGQRAAKGVFITTSSFSRDAIDYAESVNPRVILVDGKQLADLMVTHDVGVSVESRYEIKHVDLDYFDVGEEEGSTGTGT